VSVCFCTLAIHGPYRLRARRLLADLAPWPAVVVTDEPGDFDGLAVRALRHRPTGPMAADYLARLPPTGQNRGAAAYHDKRFALRAALDDFETAIFLDADSRVAAVPPFAPFAPGLSVLPVVRNTIAGHLETCGTWRRPVFVELAVALTGASDVLHEARWCHETCYAVTRDGRESRFFEAWDHAVALLQERQVYSGEGGVMGLAAACAGWPVEYQALERFASLVSHEGGGPKAP
jgi:hypothetical protein